MIKEQRRTVNWYLVFFSLEDMRDSYAQSRQLPVSFDSSDCQDKILESTPFDTNTLILIPLSFPQRMHHHANLASITLYEADPRVGYSAVRVPGPKLKLPVYPDEGRIRW